MESCVHTMKVRTGFGPRSIPSIIIQTNQPSTTTEKKTNHNQVSLTNKDEHKEKKFLSDAQEIISRLNEMTNAIQDLNTGLHEEKH